MATISNIQCPWKKFYKQVIKCMNSLHIEACEPQMKIARFMYAVKHNFASTTINLTKDSKKSTKQLQGSEKSKIMAQNTSNSDTNSTYNTESESNYTKHLPRPPCSSKATRQHSRPCPNKNQQLINTKCIQKTKPSHIPIPNHTKSNYRKQKPANKPQVQQQTSSLPRPYDGNQQTTSNFSRPCEEITRKQPTPTHPDPTSVIKSPQKSPLLPTLPVQIKHTDIPRPSAFYNSKPTFSGPSPVNNHRFHQQHCISRPYTTRYNNPQPPLLPRPSCQHQNLFTRPYQQHQQLQGHCTQQVSLPPYVPIIILTPYNQINKVLAQQTKLFNPHQY